jgi:GTP-binding protein Era
MNHADTLVKSGMVTIVGPPNAGKSTLMNAFLGQKISIVSHKPQTTRNRIVGIMNGVDFQVVFLDTPGLHRAREILNVEMVRLALASLAEVDLVLFLVDAQHASRQRLDDRQRDEWQDYFQELRCPAILVLNKIDLVERTKLLPLIEQFAALYAFHGVIPISAKTGDGLAGLQGEIISLLPRGPRYFPEDMPTDATERFLCGEIIREKVFLLTGQEIPYSTAVLLESFQEDEERRLVTVHAIIVVEKDSQKGIVIGRGGHKLKAIGSNARRDMEKLLGSKVVLKLWVKVKKNWTQDSRFLKELGF